MSQFLPQFKLDMHHKLGKKQIISDALSHLTSANTPHADSHLLKPNALFTYNITLV